MKHLAKDMTPEVTWQDITPGGAIFEGGTSETVQTGDWRTIKPVLDAEKCKQCLLCVPVCPDMSIPMENGAISITFTARAAASAPMSAPLTPLRW